MKKDKTLTPDRLRGLLEDRGASPQDLERFDEVTSRRKFFSQLGKGGAALAVLGGFGAGTEAAMQGLFGRGMLPVAMASGGEEVTDEQAKRVVADKPGINLYAQRPINAEFDAHEMGDAVTPYAKHFVRNNDLVPEEAFAKNLQGWSLTIDGEVHNELKLSLDDLKRMKTKKVVAPIECGGNGRAFFDPPVRGNQWKHGAIGASEWTGVPLRDILRQAGLKNSAVYTGHYGYEPILGDRPRFSRGIPMDKAMEEHTIVAFQMNGEDIPAVHGWPVRLVVPGWYGSASHKWLNRIWIRDREHDGRGMTGFSYRMPKYPVRPGERPPEEDMVVGGPWPIKSMITSPAPDNTVRAGQSVKVRGHAWAGEDRVTKVEISTDFGLTWRAAKVSRPANKYAWVQFEQDVRLPNRGYYEIWARAHDHRGNMQPIVQPWNPRGYEGNLVHRVPVEVQPA
ncbi:sulfite oxidase [Ectothiorhodospiraceae bacterium 2226]|nr:sulfite oxidase [Ectothiorhodospiraceae bacterium 2226]